MILLSHQPCVDGFQSCFRALGNGFVLLALLGKYAIILNFLLKCDEVYSEKVTYILRAMLQPLHAGYVIYDSTHTGPDHIKVK